MGGCAFGDCAFGDCAFGDCAFGDCILILILIMDNGYVYKL
jgi:hypothetical protein